MKITRLPIGTTTDDLQALAHACRVYFDGDVTTSSRGARATGTLRYDRALDPQEFTRRRSAEGRRTVGVTWQAHKAFFVLLFNAYPDARVQTAMAVYNGRAEFERLHAATANRNAGSIVNPVRFADL